MSDVARLAGVGTMTVSRVLSGTVPVSEETAQRVQTAIDQLNYRPNELARAFRGQKSRSPISTTRSLPTLPMPWQR